MHTHVTEAGSDSRIARELAKDPVCGMMVDKATALSSEQGGRTFYFCSPACKRTFEDPERELKSMRRRVSIALSGVLALAILRAGAFIALAAGATLPRDLKVVGLKEIYRVLKYGGRLFLAEPDRPNHRFWRIIFWPIGLHPNLRDHLQGRMPDLLRSVGFVSLTPLGHWHQLLTFWSALKPAS